MNVKLFSAGFLPFCSGCRTSRLMIPNLAAALRQYLLMLKPGGFCFPLPQRNSKTPHRKDKRLVHRRKEGLSSVACRAEHPKEGGCLNAPVFRGAAAAGIAKL